MLRRIYALKLKSSCSAIKSLVSNNHSSYSVIRTLAQSVPKTESKQHPKSSPMSAITELFLSEKGFKLKSENVNKSSESFESFADIESLDLDVDIELLEEQDPLKYAEGDLESYVEDVIAVPTLKGQAASSKKVDINMIGTPDPRIPMSDIPCQGCGACLHCTDQSIPGYMPSQRFTSLNNQQLKRSLCQRCTLLENFNICLNVRSTEDEFRRIIETINEETSLIVLIVDVTDIRNSLMSNLFKLIKKKNRPLFVVGNKVDAIPMDEEGYLRRIKKELMKECKNAGLNPGGSNIKYCGLISAKTGYGVEDLVSNLMVQWKYYGNVYLLGNTNAGKSTLFNALLQSDYCKSRAREIVHRATVSVWPGTTINTLKFPILNPRSWRVQMREARLKNDKAMLLEERNLQKSIVQEKENLRNKWKSATLTGYLGITDFQEDEAFVPPKYSLATFEMQHDSIVSHIGREHLLNLPPGVNFDDEDYQKSNRWLFDTPGVICEDQIINLLTPPELVSILPKEVVPPRVFLLKPNQTMFITAMGRIDYVEGGNPIFLTVHMTSNLRVYIRSKEEADQFYEDLYGSEVLQVPQGDEERMETIPALVGKEFLITGHERDDRALADIQLSSLGWVSVAKTKIGDVKLRAYTPGARGLYLREPALVPHIKSFRGKRIGGKQEYRTKPPKMI